MVYDGTWCGTNVVQLVENRAKHGCLALQKYTFYMTYGLLHSWAYVRPMSV